MLGRVTLSKPILQWDPVVPGLGMRLNRDGSRQYIARISIRGNKRMFCLGPAELIVLDEARRLVQRMKLLAKTGDNPSDLVAEFRKEKADPKYHTLTFSQFVDIYLERYAKIYKKSWLKDKQRIDLYLMPEWKDRRLSSITRHDFREVFTKIGKTRKYAANRLKETVSTVFKQAVVMSFLQDDFVNPTYGIREYKEHSRKTKLSIVDLPKLMKAIKAHPDQLYAKAILMVLYTGLRHGEVIRLKWSWFDMQNNTMMLPASITKNEKPHLLPISKPVERLLASMPRYPNSEYIFHSPKTRLHISRLTRAWQQIRAEAGMPTLRIHDLRRSAGCLILEQSKSIAAVRDILNQSSDHITKVYGFYDKASLKPILEEYGELIEKYYDT